ncbi:MAG TPA: UvrB/UvrC motif-containing protein [Candidatus Intestinimonas pullistercoris]|uniref:UvrB/UvrC motif-containing protein n=1 Tax=Candidatus Intestinimonas pullistercoris TaxID=2838623 RepID=A0A9D2T148_9FIRM|nr:UvrB/UvrC motif-containing protein [Candidatus Intestinimonas pullistercoris]
MGPHPRWGAPSGADKRFAQRAKPCRRGNSFAPRRKKNGVPARRKPGGAMREASKRLEFEYAAVLRDRIIELKGK